LHSEQRQQQDRGEDPGRRDIGSSYRPACWSGEGPDEYLRRDGRPPQALPDRHKRSQIAIVDAAGVPQRNPTPPNDRAKLVPILGTLPPGPPVAFEAAYGWGWLVELPEELELE